MIEFTAIVEQVDGLFIASIMELNGCNTQAKSRKELAGRIEEAIHRYVGDDVEFEVCQTFV